MAKKKNIKKNTQREKSKVKISSDNPYSFRNYIEFFLWLVVILLSLVGLIKRNNILLQLTAYTLVFLGIYLIITYLYFKKSPILSGISPTSKISIVGTFILAALLFYFAYYILAHFV